MNSLFIKILSLSLSSALLLIPLLLFQPLYKKHWNKSWQFYVYLIVILRSLLPFGAETNLLQNGIQFAAVQINLNEKTDMKNEPIQPAEQEPADGIQQKTEISPTKLPPTLASLINKHAIGTIWLGITIFLCLRTVIIYTYSTRRLRLLSTKTEKKETVLIYQEVCREFGLRHFPKLKINTQAPSPMLIGIFHPVILLPDEAKKQSELRYIFMHELTHYKRLDLLYKWIMQLAVCIHWFNPLLYLARRETDKNCEFSCDESVIRGLSANDKYEYGNTLIAAIQPWKQNTKTKVSITLNEELAFIKERLESIMSRKKKSIFNAAFTFLFSMILLFGIMETGANAFELPENPVVSSIKTTAKAVKNTDTPLAVTNCKIVYDNTAYKWPSIEETVKNLSDKVIVSYESSWLAFDKNGKPLKLYWDARNVDEGGGYGNVGFGNGVDYGHITGIKTFSKKSYLWETDTEMKINAGKTKVNSGWYLFDGWWDQPSKKHKAAYLLSCIKTVTFRDGTVWNNPDYDNWVASNKGKTLSVTDLKAYYQ